MFGWFEQRKEKNTAELFVTAVDHLIALQLRPKFQHPKDAFMPVMENSAAAGYVFGMHATLIQHWRLVDPAKPDAEAAVLELLIASYNNLFGEVDGWTLLKLSLKSLHDADFCQASQSGDDDVVAYLKNKTLPAGLARILDLGMPE